MMNKSKILAPVCGLVISACANQPIEAPALAIEFSHAEILSGPEPLIRQKTEIEPFVVYFANDSHILSDQSHQAIAEFVAQFEQRAWRPLVIEGHTDWNHDNNYNQALAARRTDSVRRHLIELGYPAYQLTEVSRGESQPVASNATDEGRRLNRRVVVRAMAPR